ncbi:MAG TPA: hypothetical protein VK084_08875 [Chitinophagaceae bacterium]|nr:hypothetical protein [Chitinophagaceae bacterium]
MRINKYVGWFLVSLFFLTVFSCQKKENFIDEDEIGNGIHYYPNILNDNYIDTFSHDEIESQDVNFKPGQQISFQLLYRSKDSLKQIELWQEVNNDSKKVSKVVFDSSFYSTIQECDTTFLDYQIPEDIDSTLSEIHLIPKIVTHKGLITSDTITVQLK